jgi:hypothetical protein
VSGVRSNRLDKPKNRQPVRVWQVLGKSPAGGGRFAPRLVKVLHRCRPMFASVFYITRLKAAKPTAIKRERKSI